MKRLTHATCFMCAFLIFRLPAIGQEPVDLDIMAKKAARIRQKASNEAAQMTKEMIRFSGKFEKKFNRLERKLFQYINKIDSIPDAASTMISNPIDHLMIENISQTDSLLSRVKTGPYLQRIDSLNSLFGFLNRNKFPLNEQLDQLIAVKNRLGMIKDYQEQLYQRQIQWVAILKGDGLLPKKLPKSLARMQTDVLAYKAKLNHWKETLNNPNKLEQEAVRILTKLPAFQEYFKENSELSALFNIPSNSSKGSASSISGLQTNSTMAQFIQNRMGKENQSGQMIIEELKAKAIKEGSSSIADNPFSSLNESIEYTKQKITQTNTIGNPELSSDQIENAALKSKGLRQRLEFAWNLQTGQRVRSFPVTNDLGLSLGYKITPKAVAGIGVSYKFGLGSWQKISLTHEGMSVRSFFDWRISSTHAKLMANFWITAGFEMNYWERIQDLQDWKHLAWQKSGLIGITKKITINKREIKMQFLYDYLNQPVQSGIPFLFRYNSTF